jgi:hypothetical protein
MTSWRTAWRSLRRAAGLPTVRFHDGRHTALTRLAEKGFPDWVIRAQFGHVSPAMMAVYSHVRRKALDKAALSVGADRYGAADALAEFAVGPPGARSDGRMGRSRRSSYVTSDVTV